jgi:hypothetical protein
MRILVEYDADGTIQSVAYVQLISTPEGAEVSAQRRPKPGHTIIEVETEEVQHERDVQGLKRLVEGYRVTGHPDQPTLTSK